MTPRTAEQGGFPAGGWSFRVLPPVAALSLVLAMFGVPEPGVAQGAQMVASPEPLRLAIPEFVNRGADPRYAVLERALPEMLGVGLASFDAVTYVDESEFRRAGLEPFVQWATRGGDFIRLNREVLAALEIDLILRGSFSEYGGKVRIEGILEDLRTGYVVELTAPVVPGEEVYFGISEFVRRLKAEVLSLGRERGANRLAIVCFTETAEPTKVSWTYGTELARSLAVSLSLDKVVILPWTETRRFCREPPVSPWMVLDSSAADAVLSGAFRVVGDQVSVEPQLYVRGMGEGVSLAPVTGEVGDYRSLELRLTEDLGEVLDAIAQGGGEWNTGTLEAALGTAQAYLERGNEILDEQGDPYLAAFMYMRALDEQPDNAEAHYRLGLTRLQQERYKDAQAAFHRALELDTGNAAALEGLGDAYAGMDRSDAAAETYRAAISASPANPALRLKLAELYYLTGEPASAIAQYQAVQTADPTNTDALTGLARVYRSQDREEEAMSALERVLALDSLNSDARASLAGLYQKRGLELTRDWRYGDALVLYDSARSLDPRATDYGWITFLLIELGRNRDAETAALEAAEVDQADFRVWNNKGYALANLGRWEEALRAYDEAIRLNPENASVFRNRGNSLVALGRLEEALESDRRSTMLDPDEPLNYAAKAYILRRLDRLKEAVAVYDTAIGFSRRAGWLYEAKAWVLVLIHSPDEALSTYETGLAAYDSALSWETSDDPWLYHNRAQALDRLGHHDDALPFYDRALEAIDGRIERDPDNPKNYIDRGYFFTDVGRLEEALSSYTRVIELNPTSYRGYNDLSYTLAELGQYRDAVAFADSAIGLSETLPYAHNHRGYSLYRLGDREEGLDLIGRTMKLDPDYGGTYYNLARILSEGGHDEDAIEHLKAAILRSGHYRRRAAEHGELRRLLNHPELRTFLRR
jgi:tetratricopeptide (TPR) repeat protein